MVQIHKTQSHRQTPLTFVQPVADGNLSHPTPQSMANSLAVVNRTSILNHERLQIKKEPVPDTLANHILANCCADPVKYITCITAKSESNKDILVEHGVWDTKYAFLIRMQDIKRRRKTKISPELKQNRKN